MGDEESHTSYVIVNMMTCPISFTHSLICSPLLFLSLTVVLNLDIVRQVGIDSSCSKMERNEKKEETSSFLSYTYFSLL